MTVIQFFFIDPEDFSDIPAGTVTIQDGEITSENPDLVSIAESAGPTPEAIIRALSDWANGYLRSELAPTERNALSTGSISLVQGSET